jgi:trk system potassium uptake protein TrkH
MRWRYIAQVVGVLLLFLGLSMLFPLICGFYYGDGSVLPLTQSMGISLASGLLLFFFV